MLQVASTVIHDTHHISRKVLDKQSRVIISSCELEPQIKTSSELESTLARPQSYYYTPPLPFMFDQVCPLGVSFFIQEATCLAPKKMDTQTHKKYKFIVKRAY